MSEFLKPRDPKAFEQAINAAHTASELREAVIQSLQREGQIVPTEDAGFNYRLQPEQAAQPAVSLPASPGQTTPGFYKVLYFGNDRLEIYGDSESELNQKEAALRVLFGGTK